MTPFLPHMSREVIKGEKKTTLFRFAITYNIIFRFHLLFSTFCHFWASVDQYLVFGSSPFFNISVFPHSPPCCITSVCLVVYEHLESLLSLVISRWKEKEKKKTFWIWLANFWSPTIYDSGWWWTNGLGQAAEVIGRHIGGRITFDRSFIPL